MAEINGINVLHSKTNDHFTDLFLRLQIPQAPIKSFRAIEKCVKLKPWFLSTTTF